MDLMNFDLFEYNFCVCSMKYYVCCNGGGKKSLKGQQQQIFDLPMIAFDYDTDLILNEQNW